MRWPNLLHTILAAYFSNIVFQSAVPDRFVSFSGIPGYQSAIYYNFTMAISGFGEWLQNVPITYYYIWQIETES